VAHTDTERWFVKRGVPHFISAYNAREDVLTRTLPFLAAVFLFSAISAIDLDWPPWAMVFAVIGGLVLLASAWMVINRMRGRPPRSRPNEVGGVEISVFLLVPVLLPLLFGGDLAGAGLTFVTLLAILILAYLVTSYGLVAITVWGVGQMARTVAETFRLFTRSLPLLLLGFMFLFVNAEAWQSAGRLDQPLLFGVIGLFAVLAAVFLLTQIPREVAGLNDFSSWADVSKWADDAPVASAESDESPGIPPLSRRETGNLWLVVFVSQAFRVFLVSSLVGVFFVALGLLIIRPETVALWTAMAPTVLATFTVGAIEVELTSELIRVSAFLAAFAAVYFSVYTTTDPTLRAEFFEDTVAEVKQNLAVRAIYLS
jgi:hypothetical protein